MCFLPLSIILLTQGFVIAVRYDSAINAHLLRCNKKTAWRGGKNEVLQRTGQNSYSLCVRRPCIMLFFKQICHDSFSCRRNMYKQRHS